MLSRRVLCRFNALNRLSSLCRHQSTFVHPVSKLGSELNEQLNSGSVDTNEIYSGFKDHLSQLSEDMTDPTTLQRSFGLNAPLINLLKRTTNDKESQVDPYQLLNTLCHYQVARSPHFEIVLRHLLVNGSPQDVIALWVKYLETVAENPNALLQSYNNRNGNNNSHETNVALATMAYLLLPDNKPDYDVLHQILQLNKDAGQRIPFNKIRFLANSIFKHDLEKKTAVLTGLSVLFHRYVDADKSSFMRQLDQTLQFHHLQDLYNQYHAADSDSSLEPEKSDPEIIAKFMDKFISCNNPAGAIKIFNDHKALDSSLLKDHLLIAVANLPASSRNLRLDRILAIWNSVIKPTNATASSFAALIQALGVSRNLAQLQTIWTEEIPQDLKKDPTLIESYLTAMLKYNGKTTYADISKQLPEEIESMDLINAVLLKMVNGDVAKADFDSFYSSQFEKKDESSSRKRPNVETLAIKMWANYHYATEKDSFDFFKSIYQSKRNSLRINAIIEHFIKCVPSIEPIRLLYEQVKEPLDSRKYGAFISAEFSKPDGDYKNAEQIFKEYLEGSRSQSKRIDKFVLEPLITGFCELAVRGHDASFLLKVSTYYSFASKIKLELTYQTTARILHTVSMLAKDNSGKFAKSEQEFVEMFLQDLEQMAKFSPNSRDLDILRKANVQLPGNLA